MIGLVAWLILMVGQLFDSAGRSGPAAVAEFLSAVLGSAIAIAKATAAAVTSTGLVMRLVPPCGTR